MPKPIDPLATLTDDRGLARRSLEIRAADTEAREITGIGVPFDTPVDLWGVREEFAPGSVPNADGALCYYRHREPIGRVIAARETPTGAEVTVKISATQLGDEALTLARDQVIRSFSIGFHPVRWETSEDDDGVTHVRHVEVDVREFSLVPDPAYPTAQISEVRNYPTEKETPMGNTETLTRADLDGLETRMADLDRSIELLKTTGTAHRAAGAAAQWRSMGEFLKALAGGNDDAAELHRAYTGAKTTDTVMEDTFVGDFVHLVTSRRRYIPLFSTGTLPATGTSVDYVTLKNDGTKVAKQANEGDDLVKGKVELQKANAPVETYGGWTELSRQLIERATVPTLDKTLQALALRYAYETDQAVKTQIIAAIKAGTAAGKKVNEDYLSVSALSNTGAWLDAIVDAAEAFEDRTYSLVGLLVDKATFKALAALKDGNDRLMNVYGSGVNQVGELALPGGTGNLAGVRVSMLAHADANTAAFYDPVAFETLESPNAPAQLQDENIVNLSKQFSVYGYLAILNPNPGALLPVKIGA